MGFSAAGRAALGRALALNLAGAAGATAAAQGLYATAAVALLGALWAGGISIAAATRPPAPAAPVAPLPTREGAERRLTALLDLSPAPLVTLDAAGRLRAVNRAARRLFTAEDLLARPPPALVEAIAAGPARRAATVELAGRAFALVTGELSVDGGGLRLAALLDIDAELKAAEAATLRELVQVLSHEIVNALTPIASLSRTAAAMLRDEPLDLRSVRDAVETVERRAAGLHRFGEAYRSLARLPAPRTERIDGPRFASDLVRLFTTRWPSITFSPDLASTPADFAGDADQLTAAIWALLQNAAEAVDGRQLPEVRFIMRELSDGTLITVADNGPGIGPEIAGSIFQPFFTTKHQGSGVGLAFSRQILRGHGGDLVLAPCTQGAEFHAKVPGSSRVWAGLD